MDIFYPLQLLADWLTYDVFHIVRGTLLASAVNFFLFDSIKIFLLLSVIIFTVSIIRSYMPPEKIRFVLARKNPYLAHVSASLLGVITPFCSCSAIPLFLGFVQAGVPLGATFSFLVASPMVNEVALTLLFGMFGWKIAAIYIASGLLIAILSGIAIGKMDIEGLIEPFVFKNTAKEDLHAPGMTRRQRIHSAATYTLDTLKHVWVYVLIGIGIGAWIHGYVPADVLVQYAGSDKWYAVPLATLIGIPMYSNAAGIIPLISALHEKGIAMGTSLAFMMAVTALSLPEFMILKKIMKTKLILLFAGIVGTGIMLTGFLFNALLK